MPNLGWDTLLLFRSGSPWKKSIEPRLLCAESGGVGSAIERLFSLSERFPAVRGGVGSRLIGSGDGSREQLARK